MKPVNLLPEADRPRRAAATEGGAKFALIALGALLLLVLVMVVTQNQINGRKGDLAKANSEAEVATQEATRLAPYGTFAQTRQTREQSIKQLADARFDWERFMRELALVLPEGTSVKTASGSASGTPEEGGGDAASASTSAEGKPTVNLTGCSKSQPQVATLMVRLRSLYRAEEVTLNDSTKPTSDEGSGSGGSGDESGAGTGGECTSDEYKYDATVTFAAEAAQQTDQTKQPKVPSTLGGGA